MADRPTRLLAAAVVVGAIGVLAATARSTADGGATLAAAERMGSTSSTASTRRDDPVTTATATSAPASSPGGTADAVGSATAPSPDPPAPAEVALAPADGDEATTIVPPPLREPAVGAYRERYDGPSGDGEGTLAVTRRGSSTTLRRRIENSISSHTVRFDEEGIHLLVTSDGGGPCRFGSSPLLQPAVLDVGTTWSSDATCTTDGGVEVQRVEEAQVTGRARTTVDGVPLDTWIIQRHIVETSIGDGVVVVSETASSELFAPGVGLAVYRLARNETPDASGEIVATAVAVELLSTTSG